jgi:hypothetical protein
VLITMGPEDHQNRLLEACGGGEAAPAK